MICDHKCCGGRLPHPEGEGLAHRRLRGDRAASPSGLSRFASSQGGITLRKALRDYRGLFFFLIIFALAVLA